MKTRRLVGYVVKMQRADGLTFEYRASTLSKDERKVFPTFSEACEVAGFATLQPGEDCGRYIVPVFKKS